MQPSSTASGDALLVLSAMSAFSSLSNIALSSDTEKL
jgi:hypothetical protein